jgi:hypothetical protein
VRRLILCAALVALAIALVFLTPVRKKAASLRPRPEPMPATNSPQALQTRPAESSVPVREESREVIATTDAPDIARLPNRSAPEGLQLRGTLRSSRDLRPVAGAKLSFVLEDKPHRVITDVNGSFETGPVLSAGVVRTWHVADGPGGRFPIRREIKPSTLLVESPAPGTAPSDVELYVIEPDVRVRVQVTRDGATTPASVVCNIPSMSSWQSQDTDSLGRAEFGLQALEADTAITLWAHASDDRSPAITLHTPLGEEVVQLTLEPSGSVRVSVRDADGRAAADEYVFVVGGGPSAFTDEDGVALLNLVTAGEVEVGAASLEERLAVVVPAHGEARAEFVVPALPVALAGRVLDERGEGLEEVVVSCYTHALHATVRSGDDGRFELRDAFEPGGKVRVTAGGGVEDDRFDPEDIAVPIGTRDLTFVRRTPLPTIWVHVAVHAPAHPGCRGRALPRAPERRLRLLPGARRADLVLRPSP